MATFFEAFHDPALCRSLVAEVRRRLAGRRLRFMEVCGTHTMAIFRSGIRSVLEDVVDHLSGPGCPVCVTHEGEVAAFLDLARRPGVTIATFGDLMRVPGPGKRSLKDAQAEGAKVVVVYSPHDALEWAVAHPQEQTVFLGVGFETTAPAVAATVQMAKARGVENFSVLCFHKLVPPALQALTGDPDLRVDAFLLPGHVSAIIGTHPYAFLARDYGIPAVIAGFEPLDIVEAILAMAHMVVEGQADTTNCYRRVVAPEGNPRALQIMHEVFEIVDAPWRGIGTIPASGLALRSEYAPWDARQIFALENPSVPPLPGCRCGEVLKGKLSPDGCPLFGRACTPSSPVGPCMVSTEGSCAAYFKYRT